MLNVSPKNDLFGAPTAPISPAGEKKSLRITQAVLPLSKLANGKHSLNAKAETKEKGETLKQKRHRLRRQAGLLVPAERVNRCGRCRHSQTVDIHRTATGAHFVGLETCGSVWHCPVCAAKIAEQRREEVAQAIEGAKEQGGATYMLTLTMRHNKHDKLAVLREQIVNGWRKVQNRRAYRAIKNDFGVLGTVRAIEVTHGANGWHPHLHILFVFEGPLFERDEDHIEETLCELWVDVLAKSDTYVSLDALDFRQATASDYVTKWGADRELVKGQEKLGNGSRTPWQLLDDVKRDPQASALFREYAETFKGTRQLTWSKGLKALFGIGEIDDIDAANDRTETDDQLPIFDAHNMIVGRVCTLDKDTIDNVVRLKKTAELQEAAFMGGNKGVVEFLESLNLENEHADSFKWTQPPKGGTPAHPRRYMTMAADKLLYPHHHKTNEDQQ